MRLLSFPLFQVVCAPNAKEDNMIISKTQCTYRKRDFADLVAVSGLVPEHISSFRVAHALRPPLLLVIPEDKVVAAGALAAPLVAAPVLRPVVLVVAGVAAAVPAEALPREGLEDDQLAGGAGTAVAHPMTLPLRGLRLRLRKVEVGLRAGVLQAHPLPVPAAHQELGRLARPRRVLAVAGVGGRPVHVLLLAAASRAAGRLVVEKELTLLAGTLGVQLEALVHGGEVVGGVPGAGALPALQAVVV